ncbi:MAG: SHOCT domain-containing protein [Gaiellaceae bacterium]
MGGSLLSVLLSGFLIGGLARLALPGPDPMPFWFTVLVGLTGALAGGGIAAGIYGTRHTFDQSNHAFVTLLLEVGAAILILVVYRRFVQRRPLSGPDARSFPSRGFGIARMRARLRQLGIDPDRLTGQPGGSANRAGAKAGDVAEQLEKLREQRDNGAITDEEYDLARERLRRY